jgi:ribosomal protein S18 acetylase RimI-like enzyme
MLQRLLFNARLWLLQMRSLAPIEGFGGALKQSLPNLFWLETVQRLETDLNAPQAIVESPLLVDLDWLIGTVPQDWIGQQPLRAVRGDYGIVQMNMRLQRGDVACCAYVQEELAGWAWLKKPPVRGAGSPLGNDEAYIFDVWVFADYRGNRVSSMMLQSLFSYCQEDLPAVRRVIIHSASWNQAALAGQVRAGMQKSAKELSVVAFGLRRNWPL